MFVMNISLFDWQGGCTAGKLTALGRDQMFMLGRQLHSLYIKKQQFLDEEFNPKQIQYVDDFH